MKKVQTITILIIVFHSYFQQIKGNASYQNPLLLYSTLKEIRLYNGTKNEHNKYTTVSLVKNLTGDRTAIDFHYAKKKICWSDHSLENIFCSSYDANDPKSVEKNKVEIMTNVTTPTDLACDWLTDKLYWTDSDQSKLEVATIEGLHRKVLFWTDLDQPRAIALSPAKGLLFWTDWGDVPKIERAGMDGDPSTRRIIVQNNIVWPNGISIDHAAETIYWIDGKLLQMESIDFEGNNRVKVLDSLFEYPFSLSIFGPIFYWTDWKTWSIHCYNRETTESNELIYNDVTVPMFIRVFDQKRQPKSANPCELQNGNCSHLCLLSPKPPGYSCACPIGIRLLDNFTCADRPLEMLLLARRNEVCLIFLDSPDYSHKVLPLSEANYTIAVDYDPVNEYIYWSDYEIKNIQRARLNGSGQEVVINSELKLPDGIAVDWLARNIYWTDSGADRIEVARLEHEYRKVIINTDLGEPRAIAVAPELGWLFWSDWDDTAPKIERSNLDGSERIALISKHLQWPNGISLDFIKRKLYWCDAKLDNIEYSNMDGSDRKVLINNRLPHVFGFSLMGDFLYWTDWQERTIERAHKVTGGNREAIIAEMPNVMGLKTIKIGEIIGRNPCSDANGGCSQFCFYRHNKSRICSCQLEYELLSDRKTCVKSKTFLLYSKANSLGVIGVENEDNEMEIPIVRMGHVSSIDYDINMRQIYWTDPQSRIIMRSNFSGFSPEKIIDFNFTAPEAIAIDSIAMNIYWTDSQAHRIEVSRLTGTGRRTLLWEGQVYSPHSLCLDPLSGYMYWSEWGSSKAIKYAAMDGSNQRELLKTKGLAASLSLHFGGKRIYWVDVSADLIVSTDLYGRSEVVMARNEGGKINAMALGKNWLFWSEARSGNVIKAALDGANRSVIYQTDGNITDLVAVYQEKYPKMNHCAVSNGGCSQLCLPIPGKLPNEDVGFTCACQTHYSLENNNCNPPKQFMIYSQKNLTVRVLISPTESLEAVLPIQGMKAVKAIDFDSSSRYLYWIEKHAILRAHSNGSEPSTYVIPPKDELRPFDLAVDSLGRLLFFTDSKQNIINVTRLDSPLPIGPVIQRKDEEPRLIALHPTKRLLFYTCTLQRVLIRTRLDGTHRLIIAQNADIAAIAVDQDNDWIVWAQNHNIYASNIEGENQHVLANESTSKITQLTVLSGWLYWIDRESSQMQRVELLSGKFSSALSLQASHIVDMVAVTAVDRRHGCLAHKCKQLCIMNETQPVCACPINNVLKEDGKSCSAALLCGSGHFSCSTNPIGQKDCIPLQWKCDGQKDCHNGADEVDCPVCEADEFRCDDGECIKMSLVCDGRAQCGDKSDEDKCCKDGFLCPNTRSCLKRTSICDSIEDCADGADENLQFCENLKSQEKRSDGIIVVLILGVMVVCLSFTSALYCLLRRFNNADEVVRDQLEDSLSPMHPQPLVKFRRGIPDLVQMSIVGSESSIYDRNHITGASSSTNASSLVCYPREPLNPPPSPATTRGSSPSRYRGHRPYRHYRVINQPPPPTPCSTDVCDESDYYCASESYPLPPPPSPAGT